MSQTRIIPYLFYRSVPDALEWLARTFGFAETLRVPTPSGYHGEMELDGQKIMMGQGGGGAMISPAEAHGATQGVFIYLSDVDAHYARARAAGARIDGPPKNLDYGRSYTAWDLDGHPWFFTTPPAS